MRRNKHGKNGKRAAARQRAALNNGTDSSSWQNTDHYRPTDSMSFLLQQQRNSHEYPDAVIDYEQASNEIENPTEYAEQLESIMNTHDELYRKVIHLRDLVMSGNHSALRPREMHSTSLQTKEPNMTGSNTTRLESAISSISDLARDDKGNTLIYEKIIRARIKLKRERSEKELMKSTSNLDSARIVSSLQNEQSTVVELGKLLDESIAAAVNERADSDVFDVEDSIDQVLEQGQEEDEEEEDDDEEEGEIGESEDDYEPFVEDVESEEIEGEGREEGEIGDEDFGAEDEDLGYSPPSPTTPDDYQNKYNPTSRVVVDDDMERNHAPQMPPPAMSVAHTQSWPSVPNSRTRSRRQTMESAQTPQQISLNLIQSPLAPQPAHISSLATGLGQHDFDSEDLNFAVSKKRKAEEEVGLGVRPYKQQEQEQGGMYSPGSSVNIRPEDMVVPKGYKLVKIEDDHNHNHAGQSSNTHNSNPHNPFGFTGIPNVPTTWTPAPFGQQVPLQYHLVQATPAPVYAQQHLYSALPGTAYTPIPSSFRQAVGSSFTPSVQGVVNQPSFEHHQLQLQPGQTKPEASIGLLQSQPTPGAPPIEYPPNLYHSWGHQSGEGMGFRY